MISKMSILTLCVALSAVATVVKGYPFGLGSCVDVDPVPNFNMTAFLGNWYVTQEMTFLAPSNIRCHMLHISEDAEKPGQIDVTDLTKSHWTMLGISVNRNSYTVNIKLRRREGAETSADMTEQTASEIDGVEGANYRVFITDYDTFAGVYVCRKLAFGNYHSAMILSRTPTLNRIYINKVRYRLTRIGVSLRGLHTVNQAGCSRRDADNLRNPINIPGVIGLQISPLQSKLQTSPSYSKDTKSGYPSCIWGAALRELGELPNWSLGNLSYPMSWVYPWGTSEAGEATHGKQDHVGKIDSDSAKETSFEIEAKENMPRLDNLSKEDPHSKTALDTVVEGNVQILTEKKSQLEKDDLLEINNDTLETVLDPVENKTDIQIAEPVKTDEGAEMRKMESDSMQEILDGHDEESKNESMEREEQDATSVRKLDTESLETMFYALVDDSDSKDDSPITKKGTA